MKRLEDIPKKDAFEAPEGYFDRLPGVIQSRIVDRPKAYPWSPFSRFAIKFALPMAVIAIALYLLVFVPTAQTPEEMIASVDTSNLVAYLSESDLTTEEILDHVSLDEEDLNVIQDKSMGDFILDDSTVFELSHEDLYKN